MTEAEFKRKLAKLVLDRAAEYVPDAQDRSYLELVASADDEVAKRWTPHVRLRNDVAIANIGTFHSLRDLGLYEPFTASFSTTGSSDAARCSLLASFAATVSGIVATAHKLVERYNAGVLKQKKTKR